jgi:hypothetical protein
MTKPADTPPIELTAYWCPTCGRFRAPGEYGANTSRGRWHNIPGQRYRICYEPLVPIHYKIKSVEIPLAGESQRR